MYHRSPTLSSRPSKIFQTFFISRATPIDLGKSGVRRKTSSNIASVVNFTSEFNPFFQLFSGFFEVFRDLRAFLTGGERVWRGYLAQRGKNRALFPAPPFSASVKKIYLIGAILNNYGLRSAAALLGSTRPLRARRRPPRNERASRNRSRPFKRFRRRAWAACAAHGRTQAKNGRGHENMGTSLETPSRARASSCQAVRLLRGRISLTRTMKK